MEIVLETIRYIRELEDQLIDRFQMDTLDSSSSSSSSPSGRFHSSIDRSISILNASDLLASFVTRPSLADPTLLRDIGNTD